MLHLPRANGFTNAIQYGGLSLLLGLMCSVALLVLWDRWKPWQRAGWAVGILLGLEGSLLSESRGGWVVLPLALLPSVPSLVLPAEPPPPDPPVTVPVGVPPDPPPHAVGSGPPPPPGPPV